MTKLQFLQEHMGQFVGGIQRFLTDELIDSLFKVSMGPNSNDTNFHFTQPNRINRQAINRLKPAAVSN